MSDFEINKAVAINRGGYCGHVEHMEHGVKEADRKSNGLFYTEKDYCNNPSDAWPIMKANGIAAVAEGGVLVGATNNSQEFYEPYGSIVYQCLHPNPLRAAMIVFLMMEEQKK